jgi:site-specific recombinase XerD
MTTPMKCGWPHQQKAIEDEQTLEGMVDGNSVRGVLLILQRGIAYGKAKHIEGGQESVHPLHGPELRALRPLQGQSPYVFVTEAGTPVTTAWFLRMIQRTGKAAGLEFPIHPHMLRHSTGYKLANQGEDTRSLAHYLGHNTARYTALAPDRFKGFWKD